MHDPLDPIVITGAGVLACNGIGREAFWDALHKGRSGIGFIDRFDTSDLPCHIGGQLWDYDPHDFMKVAEVKRWHRHVHLGVSAAQLAVDDSEFASAGYGPERIAVGFGTSVGSPDENYEHYLEIYRKHGLKKVNKLLSSASSGHAPTAAVSARFRFRGPATTIATGCSTGLDVLNWGKEQIRKGLADAAVVGVSESLMSKPAFSTACVLGILSPCEDQPEKAMRPFDRASDGMVLSEGAAAVVLERAANARARGARILGEFAGFGIAAEGRNAHLLDQEGKALARAMEQALSDSGMRAADIDCAFCHGVSLPMYDRCETAAYKRALGPHAYRIPVTASKSMTGQAYSAGGLIGVVGGLMSLNTGVIPPTLNLRSPRPECDLDFVPLNHRLNDVSSVMATTLSFGGTHSAVVLRNLN